MLIHSDIITLVNKETKAIPETALRLDRSNRLPLHAKAEQLMREIIRHPHYAGGSLLPDEVSLAQRLGISRTTLRAAIGRLVTEGRLERKAGVGTRVVEPRVHSGIGAWHSFTREMAAKGIAVETYFQSVKIRPALASVARGLKIEPDTPVLCVERVRGWESQPEVHFQSYLHPRIELSERDDFARPLYELIQERGSVVADESLEEIQAVSADRRLARLLAVPIGTALLRRVRTVLDTGRRPMEYALVHYRCDRFSLTLNLRKE